MENINIAVLGPVSAGKSTLINSLFCDTMSEMQRKRTTMLPQLYQITNNPTEVMTSSTILEMNSKSNQEVLEERKANTFNPDNMKELIYKVKEIPDFIDLRNTNATYSILDMPGLNDQDSEMYYNYIRKRSSEIDIYIIMYDVNSSLNTTDEVKILKFVANEIRRNGFGYLHIIMNKCDDFDFVDDGTSFHIEDTELSQLYDQAEETISSICEGIKWSMSPIVANTLYVYRVLKHNKTGNITESELDNLIKHEFGKVELKKLNTFEKKKKLVKGKINALYNDGINGTGFTLFKHEMNRILKNYDNIIGQHIIQTIDRDLKSTDNLTEKLTVLHNQFDRYKRLKKDDKALSKLEEATKNILTYVKNGLRTYISSDLDTCELNIDKMYKLRDAIDDIFETDLAVNLLIQDLIARRIELLNQSIRVKYNEDVVRELKELEKLDLESLEIGIIRYLLNYNDETKDIELRALELIKSMDRISLANIMYLSVIMRNFGMNDTKHYYTLSDIINGFRDTMEVNYLWQIYSRNKRKAKHVKFNRIFEINLSTLLTFDEYKVLVDRYTEIHNKLREIFTKSSVFDMMKPDIQYEESLSEESETESDCDSKDSGMDTESYSSNDESDTVYQKAKNNTTKRTNKIMYKR